MLDNEFDNFVNGKLKDHAAPVPAGLWDKVADAQFDSFFNGKIKDKEAPVPPGLWEKITDPSPFDNFVSGKLKDYTAPVPVGLWEKVRPQEKDDRKGFAWFRNPGMAIAILAGLLLAGSLGDYLYTTSGNNTNTGSANKAITKPSQKEHTNENVKLSRPNNQPAVISDPSAKEPLHGDQKANTDAITGIPKKEEKATSNEASANSPATSSQASTAPITPHVNPSALGTESAALLRPALRNKSSFSLESKNNSVINGLPGNSAIVVNGNRFSDREKNLLQANSNPILINKSTTEEKSFEFIEPYHTNLLTAVTIPTGLNRFDGLLTLSDKQLMAGKHTSQFRNVVICPTDRKSRNTDLQLEIYTSPDFAFRSVKNNTASQQYLLRKDSSESMRVGFTAGIRLVKHITDNILVKAGVQYSQMNQKYVYRTENEVKTITVVSVRTIIRAPGDTVIVRDTSILQQIGYKNNTVINRFRSFDIPVTVGYQFGDEDLKIGINAGVILNVSSWYQGVLLDSSLATVPIAKGNANMVYKSNIGLGLYGGISIVKKLGEDLHIFAEPYIRYNLSNMTTPQASYNQKFCLGGISVGLRFNLNR